MAEQVDVHDDYEEKWLRTKTQFYNNRIVNDWNKLEDEKIKAQTTNGFKRRFDGEMVVTSKGTTNTLYG